MTYDVPAYFVNEIDYDFWKEHMFFNNKYSFERKGDNLNSSTRKCK